MKEIINKLKSENLKKEITESWSWISHFLGKAFGFFFLVILILLIYFVIGNFQSFLDHTQIALINSISLLTLSNFLLGIFYMASLMFDHSRPRKSKIFRLVLSLFLTFFMLLFTLFFKFFTSWFQY